MMRFIYAAILTMVCFSCGSKADYSEEIKTLDSLQTEVLEVEKTLQSLDLGAVKNVEKQVKGALAAFQDQYKGELSLDEGTKFSRFKDIASGVKNFGSKYKHAATEVERTKAQLAALQKALSQGANKDSQGNSIDEAYVQEQFSKEKEMAESLMDGINDLKERQENAIERFKVEAPVYLNLMDSLMNAQ